MTALMSDSVCSVCWTNMLDFSIIAESHWLPVSGNRKLQVRWHPADASSCLASASSNQSVQLQGPTISHLSHWEPADQLDFSLWDHNWKTFRAGAATASMNADDMLNIITVWAPAAGWMSVDSLCLIMSWSFWWEGSELGSVQFGFPWMTVMGMNCWHSTVFHRWHFQDSRIRAALVPVHLEICSSLSHRLPPFNLKATLIILNSVWADVETKEGLETKWRPSLSADLERSS